MPANLSSILRVKGLRNRKGSEVFSQTHSGSHFYFLEKLCSVQFSSVVEIFFSFVLLINSRDSVF